MSSSPYALRNVTSSLPGLSSIVKGCGGPLANVCMREPNLQELGHRKQGSGFAECKLSIENFTTSVTKTVPTEPSWIKVWRSTTSLWSRFGNSFQVKRRDAYTGRFIVIFLMLDLGFKHTQKTTILRSWISCRACGARNGRPHTCSVMITRRLRLNDTRRRSQRRHHPRLLHEPHCTFPQRSRSCSPHHTTCHHYNSFLWDPAIQTRNTSVECCAKRSTSKAKDKQSRSSKRREAH
jgi:hypothetical protein